MVRVPRLGSEIAAAVVFVMEWSFTATFPALAVAVRSVVALFTPFLPRFAIAYLALAALHDPCRLPLSSEWRALERGSAAEHREGRGGQKRCIGSAGTPAAPSLWADRFSAAPAMLMRYILCFALILRLVFQSLELFSGVRLSFAGRRAAQRYNVFSDSDRQSRRIHSRANEFSE